MNVLALVPIRLNESSNASPLAINVSKQILNVSVSIPHVKSSSYLIGARLSSVPSVLNWLSAWELNFSSRRKI